MSTLFSFTKKDRNKNADSAVYKSMDKQKRYEALVRAWHKDLFRYAYWLCKDKSIAEDLVQETCLRAWRSLDSLKDEKSAKSWLITILRRENARRFERKRLELVDIDDHHVEDKSLRHSEDDIEKHWLHQKILALEPEYREPLLLQVIGGFSGDEISDILGLNRNTVMTRLFRARNQLKEQLDNQHKLEGQNNG